MVNKSAKVNDNNQKNELEPRKIALPLQGLVDGNRFTTKALKIIKEYIELQKYGTNKEITKTRCNRLKKK